MTREPQNSTPRDPGDSLLRWTLEQLERLQHRAYPPPRTLSLLLKKRLQAGDTSGA